MYERCTPWICTRELTFHLAWMCIYYIILTVLDIVNFCNKEFACFYSLVPESFCLYLFGFILFCLPLASYILGHTCPQSTSSSVVVPPCWDRYSSLGLPVRWQFTCRLCFVYFGLFLSYELKNTVFLCVCTCMYINRFFHSTVLDGLDNTCVFVNIGLLLSTLPVFIQLNTLGPWYSNWTSRTSITWELIRNTESQIYWIKICSFSKIPRWFLMHRKVWNALS